MDRKRERAYLGLFSGNRSETAGLTKQQADALLVSLVDVLEEFVPRERVKDAVREVSRRVDALFPSASST